MKSYLSILTTLTIGIGTILSTSSIINNHISVINNNLYQNYQKDVKVEYVNISMGSSILYLNNENIKDLNNDANSSIDFIKKLGSLKVNGLSVWYIAVGKILFNNWNDIKTFIDKGIGITTYLSCEFWVPSFYSNTELQ